MMLLPSSLKLPRGGGYSGLSAKRDFLLFSQFDLKRRFRFRFLENGSGGSGADFGFGKDGFDCSGFRLVLALSWK